ncbi:Uncharacterised protein [Salmonella enterica subsp. enterica serovar Typhimurium str. DT104]|nr:Uncharacterised protein [Salmonella enterica subsp. enterica serovar Typhimurium str. DT104]
MAAVTGYIDDFMPVVRQLAYALGVMHVNSLVKSVPGKPQNPVGQTNHLVREVRRDLFHQRNGVLLRFFMRDFFTARFVFYRAGDRFRGQQFVKQILTGRQAWANRRQALASKVHTRHASQLLRDDFIGAVFISHTTQ